MDRPIEAWPAGNQGAGDAPETAAPITEAAPPRNGDDTSAPVGVRVRVAPGVSGTVYFGYHGGITASGGTQGIPLQAGEAETLRVSNANKVFVVRGGASQTFIWHVVNRGT